MVDDDSRVVMVVVVDDELILVLPFGPRVLKAGRIKR